MIRRQSTTRYDTVDVRMSLQSLSPGMQNAEEADLGTEASWICRNFQQGCGTGIEQESEQLPLVLPDQRDQCVRHAEDQVEVANRQQFPSPSVQHFSLALVWHFGQCRLRQEL